MAEHRQKKDDRLVSGKLCLACKFRALFGKHIFFLLIPGLEEFIIKEAPIM